MSGVDQTVSRAGCRWQGCTYLTTGTPSDIFDLFICQVLIRLYPELGADGRVHLLLATRTASAKYILIICQVLIWMSLELGAGGGLHP